MHAALIQMNSAVSLQVWGNEDLLEAPLFNSPCILVNEQITIRSFRPIFTKDSTESDD